MQLVKAQELAKCLSVTKLTVFRYAKEGIIPTGYKIGRSRRWDIDEVKAYIDRQQELKA